jgi:glycosyltransferase 2 family protein
LWLVNMVGEALNVVMPFGALGGEPVKAWLLKRHYAVGYREAAATLVLMQTLLGVSEAVFVAAGALFAAALNILPPAVEHLLSAAALSLVGAMVLAIIGLQQRWLRNLLNACERRFGGARYAAAKDSLMAIEQALADFASHQPLRFASSALLFLLNWLGGAAEVWLLLTLLGSPLPFAHCWVAEAAIVTIRSLTFFLPAQLGSVEAVTVYVISALGGGAELGLALVALRRARELAWSVLGLGVGAAYQLEWRAAARG